MKTRIITGLVGLAAAIVVVSLFHTLVFNVVVAALSIIAVSEMFHAVFHEEGNKPFVFMFLSYFIAVLFPFGSPMKMFRLMPFFVFLYFIVSLVCLLKVHEKVKFSTLALYMVTTLLICFGLSCMVFLRDKYRDDALFYLLFALFCAWASDTGAYFAGYFFGKHKLAPKISPKKTVEGAIGGIIFNTLLCLALAFVYKHFFLQDSAEVAYIMVLIYSVLGALLGILGDLTASIIKRQNGIKDYGSILPGHGGILDRFDSVIFTVPAIFFLSAYGHVILR